MCPFCLCWANQSWSGIWHGDPKTILIEQTYPGAADDEAHFIKLLPAFRDRRYVTVEGRPLFVIFRPLDLPEVRTFIARWQQLARLHGLKPVYFAAHLFDHERCWDYKAAGFDAAVIVNQLKGFHVSPMTVLRRRWQQARIYAPSGRYRARVDAVIIYAWYNWLRIKAKIAGSFRNIVRYEDATPLFFDGVALKRGEFPCAVPNWDNTARSGRRGFVLHNSTPTLFEAHLREVVKCVAHLPCEERIIFIKSWNEWAEGNYLEPDQRFGHGYLDAVRKVIL